MKTNRLPSKNDRRLQSACEWNKQNYSFDFTSIDWWLQRKKSAELCSFKIQTLTNRPQTSLVLVWARDLCFQRLIQLLPATLPPGFTQNQLIGYRGDERGSRNNFLSKRCYPPKSATPAGQIAFDIPLNVTIWTRKLDGAQINDLPNKGWLEFSVLANSRMEKSVCREREDPALALL